MGPAALVSVPAMHSLRSALSQQQNSGLLVLFFVYLFCSSTNMVNRHVCSLDVQVQQMKSTWDAKEQRLTDERDKAVAAAAAAGAKLRDVDDAFRRQLDTMETSHRAAIAELTAAKQAEVDSAQRRTVEVEDEMRVLLHETDVTKQNMEARIRKLTSAFSDLQQDFIR